MVNINDPLTELLQLDGPRLVEKPTSFVTVGTQGHFKDGIFAWIDLNSGWLIYPDLWKNFPMGFDTDETKMKPSILEVKSKYHLSTIWVTNTDKLWVVPPPCNSRKGFTFRFNRGLQQSLLLGLLQVGGSSQDKRSKSFCDLFVASKSTSPRLHGCPAFFSAPESWGCWKFSCTNQGSLPCFFWFFFKIHLGVSKNKGKTPKMDDLFSGNSYY